MNTDFNGRRTRDGTNSFRIILDSHSEMVWVIDSSDPNIRSNIHHVFYNLINMSNTLKNGQTILNRRADNGVLQFDHLVIYFRNSSLAWREYRWAKTVKTIRNPIAEIHLVITKSSTPSSPIMMDTNSPVRMIIISGSLGFTSSNMTMNMDMIYK